MDIAQLNDTLRILCGRLIRLDFAGLRRILQVNSLFAPTRIHANFTAMDQLLFSKPVPADTSHPAPLPTISRPLPDLFDLADGPTALPKWQADRAVSGMVVLHRGKLIYEDYFHNTTAQNRRISWSMSKSVLSATAGVLWGRGQLPDLDATIGDLVPDLRPSAYNTATLRNVLQMSSGIAFNEDYLDYHSDINQMGRLLGIGGSMDQFAADRVAQEWTPGRYTHYVSVDTHVIGMVMRAATGRATDDLIRELLFDPIGLERAPIFLTDSLGEPFVLGGLNMTTRDYARFGQMMCQGGRMGGQQIVPEEWVELSTTPSAPPPDPEAAKTPYGTLGYGYQWWTPPNARSGEFLAVGIYGQNIYINRAAELVIAVNGADRQFRDGDGAVIVDNIRLYRQIVDAL